MWPKKNLGKNRQDSPFCSRFLATSLVSRQKVGCGGGGRDRELGIRACQKLGPWLHELVGRVCRMVTLHGWIVVGRGVLIVCFAGAVYQEMYPR